jgi:hypothetical protein
MKYLIIFLMAINLVACSAVSGLGKDITSTADWTKDQLNKGK